MTTRLLSQYEQGADRIAAAIQGVPEHVMSYSPSADEWSINEILVHLSDSEIIASERFRRALADEDPSVWSFDESVWGERLHYAARDPMLALDLFRLLRRANADLLRRISDADWKRASIHSQRGPMTVADHVQHFVDHVDYHVRQIDVIKTANGIR